MGTALSCDAETRYIKQKISSYPVVVFSCTSCPFCPATHKLLDEARARYEVFELDKLENGEKIVETLGTMTGVAALPRVFINGKFIGGAQETNLLKNSGELEQLLKSASALKPAS